MKAFTAGETILVFKSLAGEGGRREAFFNFLKFY